MGISPTEFKRMSMWEMAAATERWIEAHDPEAGKKMSEAEKDDVWEWMQKKGRPLTLKEARAKANGSRVGQTQA